jgi:hypothetical protein
VAHALQDGARFTGCFRATRISESHHEAGTCGESDASPAAITVTQQSEA